MIINVNDNVNGDSCFIYLLYDLLI